MATTTITIADCEVSGGCDVHITSQGSGRDNLINLQNTKVKDNTRIYIDDTAEEAMIAELESDRVTDRMCVPEYKSIQKVLAKKKKREAFWQALSEHLANFATGVAVEIVSRYVLK